MERKRNSIKLGLIKDNKTEFFDNAIYGIKHLVDIKNIDTLYCNTTGKKIIKNDSFIYIENEIINNSKKMGNDEYEISYNLDSKQEPDYITLNINSLLDIKLTNGVIYILKYLDNVTIIP